MNTVIVEIEDSSCKDLVSVKKVKDFLKKVLENRNLSNVEFSVSFVDEERMHELNLEYRNIDSSTDILSFAVEDETDIDFVLPKRAKRNLGDMIICTDVLKRNAQYFNVPEEEELQRLLIHGVLHLSGMNHNTNEATEPMLILQEEILKSLIAL